MSKSSFQSIKELHQAGKLSEARQGYLELLNQQPNDANVLHMLGILEAEEGNLDDAQEYIERATSLEQSDITIHLHLANILKAKGLYSQAIEVLQKIIATHPEYAAAHNNLGNLYFVLGKWEEAIHSYQNAIKLQANYLDAYYNMGLALSKAGRLADAIHTYESLIEIAPDHPGARFQLGCLFMMTNDSQSAIKNFLIIEREHPFHLETQTNLATCFLRQGNFLIAKTHYLKALEIEPDAQVLFNLGVIAMQQSQLEEATGYYLQALKLDPDLFAAHNNLGVVYLATQNRNAALLHFREALRIQPQQTSIKHIIDIISQDKKLTATPKEYIQSLFDSYANHYDAHLLKDLHYSVPDMMLQILQKYYQLTSQQWDILDLGCGTGLCGERVKTAVNTLTGVDLSANMLDQAKQKQVYDELVAADMLDYLKEHKSAYDLILAGDVLVYHGDLELLFSCVAASLRSQGLFIFNTEISEDEVFTMTSSGRFSHKKEYIENLAHEHDFAILHHQIFTIRVQNDTPVLGQMFLLTRK